MVCQTDLTALTAFETLRKALNHSPEFLNWLRVHVCAASCPLTPQQKLTIDYMCQHNFGVCGVGGSITVIVAEMPDEALPLSKCVNVSRPLPDLLQLVGEYLEGKSKEQS